MLCWLKLSSWDIQEKEMIEKTSNVDELLEKARSEGVSDPEVFCHTHNFKTTYNSLSPFAREALHAGLDVAADQECLLKCE